MKKNVKNLIKYLEMETSITIDLSSISPTRRTVNTFNHPICLNIVGINDGTLGLAIISCGCKNCKNILCIEVLYCQNGAELFNAKQVMNQIQSAVPSIPVAIRLVDEPD